jgi:uncharacterized membrane protein
MAQTPAPEHTTPQRLVIEDRVLVEAPIEEVYQQWGDLNHFPDFMRNIISVTPIGDDRYHWIASFFGQRQEWDAEVIAREERRHVAWRSVGGDDHSGELLFDAPNPTATEVRLRLEVTPPEGLAQQRIEKLAQNARKNTHNDLRRYGQQMSPQQKQRAQRDEAPTGALSVATQVGVAMAAAGVGGYVAYLANQRLLARRGAIMPPRAVALPAAVASWALLGASGASVAGAGALRQLGRMHEALFVGQWAPTLLAAAGLARALGHRDVQPTSGATIASWSFVGGSVGTIAASVALHLNGRRKQGLFVGQWAPSLMGAALFTRLVDQE